ncbi:hypothetical protein H1P_3900001 [Hyella patelloides LEGE 07179]|uniref:Tetratricopeptide repeat protein n=1 Tax=Hyella patelloides LEGE 07179 TaxID=945734 RepID=A0A563VWX7_9CYAN|nr:hypothetical protein [Hyella patelloides]VEP15964.1 hypothetical protein H1P_3900001 [Hyella patelloides LEGE 07179]
MRLITLSLLLSLSLGGCGLSDSLNYDEKIGVPEETIEERDAWGQKHLGASYQRGINWVKNAEIVEEKVGNVIAVAPLGKPNYVESYFTDGLQGNITLEVIGDKGKAVFSANDIAPCATESTCFKSGTLTVNSEKIPIHHTGISLEEFNQPPNRIKALTQEIKFYNRKLLPNTHPHKSLSSIHGLWFKRAKAYADNQEFTNAISDMETAIALLSKNNQKPSRIIEQESKKYARQLALYNYYLEQFDKSAELIQNAIAKNNFKQNQKYLDDNNLWLWIVRMRAGKQDLANRELKQAMQIATQQEKFCSLNIALASLFLEEMKEQELFQNLKDNPAAYIHNCGFLSSRLFFDGYYYAGQKQIVNGNLKKGKELLQKSLEYEAVNRDIERELAIYELNKINNQNYNNQN